MPSMKLSQILLLSFTFLLANGLTNYTENYHPPSDIDALLVNVATQEDTYEYQLPYVCSFDQKEGLRYYPSNCGIIQEEFEDDCNWALRAGPTPSRGTGPESDKSLSMQGYYMHFESSKPITEGQFAIFATPWLSASHENVCLSFWFNMEGDIGMGLLDVLLDIAGQTDPQSIFQTDGPHGREWLPFYQQIRLPVQHSFRLRFIATKGRTFRSDMAIDEIVVKEVKDDESCVPLARYPNIASDSVLFYSFDSDTLPCPLLLDPPEQLKNHKYSWNVTSVEGYKFGTGPDIGDHTKGKHGMYLVAASEAGEPGSSARVSVPLHLELVTRTNLTKTDLCVDFYYMTFGRQMGELKLNVWFQGVEHEFISIKHPTNRAWYQYGKILKDFAESNVTIVLEAIRGGTNMSDMAVDDLHVYYCSFTDHVRWDTSLTTVLTPYCRDGAIPCAEKDGCMLPEYLCDGIAHCFNASDEKFCNLQCGVPAISPSLLMTKIVYGQTVRPHSWPWQVALIDSKDESQFCGGSIIHPFWILTAAHCLTEYSSKESRPLINMVIRVGDHSLLYNTEASQMDYYPSGLFMHPEFNKPYRANDFGLIRLQHPILFRQEIQPVCLPWFSMIPVGSTCVVTGWGHTALSVPDSSDDETGRSFRRHGVRYKRTLHRLPPSYLVHREMSNFRRTGPSPRSFPQPADVFLRRISTIHSHTTQLQQVFLPIVSDEVCRNATQYSGMLSESMLCAGYLQSMIGDSCHGDSGGPLTCKRPDGSWEVHGVTSFGGLRCAEEGHPGIYAKVVFALDWISQVMGEDARVLKKKRADTLDNNTPKEVSSTIPAAPGRHNKN